MRLSVNELEVLARRAAVGAGVDHGHALEAGQALVWLCSVALPCVAGFAAALDAWSRRETGPVAAESNGGVLVLKTGDARPACPFYAAPAARDFALVMARPSGFDGIEIINVAQPCLVLGHFAMDQLIGDMTVDCLEHGTTTSRWEALLPEAGSASGVAVKGDLTDQRAADIRIAAVRPFSGRNGHPRDPWRRMAGDMEDLFARGVAVEANALEYLKRFYNQTLVPDSHASRQRGAGAGLVDSD